MLRAGSSPAPGTLKNLLNKRENMSFCPWYANKADTLDWEFKHV